MSWSNGLAQWIEKDIVFISVVFSWRIPEAVRIAKYYQMRGFDVRVGGTILALPQNAQPFIGIAQIGGDSDALIHHNPDATIASRGCPVDCWFCIVPKVEGKSFTLIPDFTPRPILCDNNLSALPVEYQEHIIKRYQETDTQLLDANSGFEPSYFDEETYIRWSKINRGAWRFAFDESKESDAVERMAGILSKVSSSRKRVYVLIGNEPFEQCYLRVQKVISWGCEPYCQAVLPLNATTRDSFKILHDWNSQLLSDFMRWANRWLWRPTSGVPLSEYKPRINEPPPFARFFAK
jgi:hypothetical protein